MAAEAQNKGKNTQEQLLASETLGTVEEGPQKKVAESKESETLSVKACSAGSLAPDSEMVTDFQKKMRRAERFGVAVKLSEQEKRNSRAERFGTGSSIHRSDESKKAEEQKRKARAERFGLPTQSVVDEEAKKKARLARFAPASKPDSVEEDKKKARAIRFSQDLSAVPSQANNGKTEDSLKDTAIVSKAGGGA